MATNIEVSIKHFKGFNTLLTKFEQNVDTVTNKLTTFNKGFIALNNAFQIGGLSTQFKTLVDSMKSIGKINPLAVNTLFRVSSAMSTLSRNPIPSIVLTGLQQFIQTIAALTKLSPNASLAISRLGVQLSHFFAITNNAGNNKNGTNETIKQFVRLNDVLAKFRNIKTSGFKEIELIFESLKTISNMNINMNGLEDGIEALRILMGNLFGEEKGMPRIGATNVFAMVGNMFKRTAGGIKNLALLVPNMMLSVGKLLAFGERPKGIMGNIRPAFEKTIVLFRATAVGLIELTEALKVFSTIKFDEVEYLRNLEVMNKLVKTIVGPRMTPVIGFVFGGGIANLFGGLAGRAGGTQAKSIAKFKFITDTFVMIADFLQKISTIKIEEGTVQAALSSLDALVRGLTGLNRFEKLGTIFSTITGSIRETGDNISNAKGVFSKIGNAIKGVFGTSFTGISSTLNTLFLPSGIIETLKKFSNIDISMFKNFSEGVEGLINALRKTQLTEGISVDDVKRFGELLNALTIAFTGIRGYEKAGNTIGALLRGWLPTAIKSIGNAFKPSIIQRLAAFSASDVLGLKRFGSVVINFANALVALSSLGGVNPEIIMENLKVINKVASVFVGGALFNLISPKGIFAKMGAFFGKGGLANQLSGADTKQLSSFARGLLDFANTFKILSSINIDLGKIDQFVTVIERTLKKFGAIGANGGMIQGFGNVFSNAIKIASDTTIKNIPVKDFENAGNKVGNTFLRSVRRVLRIKSPSQALREIANFSVKGFTLGIQAGTGAIGKAGSLFARVFFNKASSAFQSESRTFGQRITGMLTGLATGSFGFNQFTQTFRTVFSGGLVNAAVEFEDQMTSIMKVIDLGDLGEQEGIEFTEGLKEGIKELATGQDSLVSGLENSFDQLTTIAAGAGQLGIAKEEIVAFTDVIGQLTIATDLTAESASFALARYSAITGNTEFERLGSTLVGLGNNFAATESEILEFSERIAGIGANAGLADDEIFAISAALAATGINAEAGGTAISQFVSKIINATASMKTGTVTAEAYTAGLAANIDTLSAKRREAERDFLAAQDRVARLTEKSALATRFNAEDAMAKAQQELANIDAQIAAAEGRIAAAPTTGVITTVGAASQELKDFAQLAGLQAQEFAQLWGEAPADAINKIIDGISKLDSATQVEMFGDLGLDSIRLADTLRRLAGAEGLLTEALEIANTAYEENNALTNEAAARSANTRSSINRMNNTFKLLKITFQDLFLEAFQKGIDNLTAFMQRLNDFVVLHRSQLKVVLEGMLKVFTIFTGTLLASNAGLFSFFGRIKLLLIPLGGLLSLLQGVVGILIRPFGLIQAFLAIKFIPALFQELTDKTSQTYQVFSQLWSAVTELFGGIFELVGVVYRLIQGWNEVKVEGENAFTGLNTFIQPVADFIQGIADRVSLLVDNLKILGQAVGIDFGIKPEDAQINALLKEREDILAGINNLTLVGAETGVPTNGAQALETYKIKPGDTFSGIAAMFGFTQAELEAANPLIDNPSLIFAGKELNLPIKFTDANGNEITTTSVPGTGGGGILGDLLTMEAQVQLLEIDETIKALEDAAPNQETMTMVERLESLSDTDIFKKIFGDDEGALERAKAQVKIIEDSLAQIATSGDLFNTAISNFLNGNWEGALINLKNAAIEFGRGVATGLSALFGGTRGTGKDDFTATQSAAARFSGAAAEDMANQSGGIFEANEFFASLSTTFNGIEEALSFVDNIDLSGIRALVDNVIGMFKNFADPIIRSVGPILENQILPMIERVFSIFGTLGGEGGEGEMDSDGLLTLGTVLGQVGAGVASFIGAVISSAGNLAASTVKLIVDLLTGIGGLMNALGSGQTDVLTNLDTFLLQPILNFSKNLITGTLDAALGFVEVITGMEMPSGAEMFADLIAGFEDFVRRLRIARLDIQLEAEAVKNAFGADNSEFIQQLMGERTNIGLADEVRKTLEADLANGVPIDLDKVVSFTFKGQTVTGSIGEVIANSLSGVTLTTQEKNLLIQAANNLFEQFNATGSNADLNNAFNIMDLLGTDGLNLDLTGLTFNNLDAATIGKTMLRGLFDFETVTGEDLFGADGGTKFKESISAIVQETLALDMQDGSYDGDAYRLTNKLYEQFKANPNFTESEKSEIKALLSGEIGNLLQSFETTNWAAVGGRNPNSGKPNPFYGMAHDVSQGLIDGLTDQGPAVNTAGINLATGLLGTMNEQLGIQSPSTKMIQMGNDLLSGLIKGLAGTEELNLVTAIQTNLIDPFMSFDLAIQLVIISVQQLIDRLLLLGTTPGGDTVLPLLSGGRKYGGSVAAGNIYQVLEDKLPFEMYKTKSGKSYFMPNEDGEIISPFAAGNNSTMKTEPKANVSGGNTSYYEIDQSVHVPVIFENAPVGATEAELNRLADTMSERIEARIKANAKKNTVNDRLTRRGYN